MRVSGPAPGGGVAGKWKILRPIAKSTISTTPLTNSGTTVSDRLATVMMRSATPSRRSAAITPRTIDNGMMMTRAMKASWTEFHRRCMVSEKHGHALVPRGTPVQDDEPAEPAPVAHDERLVDTELVIDLGDRRCRGEGSQPDATGVAGDDLKHEKDEHRQQQQGRHEQKEAAQDQPAHAAASFVSSRPVSLMAVRQSRVS